MRPMNWPTPTPTSEKLPPKIEGHPHSADVLAFDAKARQWFVATFMFDDVESETGSWSVNGEVVNAADVTHWVPLPPAP
jgi:hypothetical protein